MSNQIKKRITITNEIFAELEKKYPIRGEKSGVCYAQDMDYVTLEVLFYENADFRILVKHYVVSQALGHNRIDTSITSYLK